MITAEVAKAARVQLQNNFWTTKKGKVQGRSVINGVEGVVQELCRQHCGGGDQPPDAL